MTDPIPVTILTGFLGAGKTTLLSNVLKDCRDREIALLINEFGQTSVDGAIMEHRTTGSDTVTIHEVNNGLIAYSKDEQFLPTMLSIKDRQKPVDNVLIETSGLALPTGITTLLAQSVLRQHFKLDAVLSVVDTEVLLSGGFDEGQRDEKPGNVLLQSRSSIATLFKRQLTNADVVVLNKIDNLNDDQLLLSELKIRKLAPSVRFVELARKAHLDIRIVLGLRLHQTTHLEAATHGHASITHSAVDGHAHSGMVAHAHGLHTHEHFHEQDPGWLSFALHCHDPLNEAILEKALSDLTANHPILRLKGFVHCANLSSPTLVQGVRDKVTISQQDQAIGRTTAHKIEPNRKQPPSQIVFIGYHLNRDSVANELSASTRAEWH
jgi:cobalamin biosynthesis protein CobW